MKKKHKRRQPRRRSSRAALSDAREKQKRYKQISRSLLKGLLFIVVVLAIKFAVEQTTPGKHLQLMSYNLLQTQLSSHSVPITIIDIGGLKQT
ncbi:MAG TPA: hypothetical protein VGO47_01455, partial [Chlamydiales bacterium]|nr:hypothetical protein [Chlamydiales bacterium]